MYTASTVKIITPFSGSPQNCCCSTAHTRQIHHRIHIISLYWTCGRVRDLFSDARRSERSSRMRWRKKHISDLINFCFNLFWSFFFMMNILVFIEVITITFCSITEFDSKSWPEYSSREKIWMRKKIVSSRLIRKFQCYEEGSFNLVIFHVLYVYLRE